MARGPLPIYGDELPTGWQLCGGQYTIERYLNSGGFGITYAARDSLDRKVVVKECFPGALCCRTDQIVRPRSRSNAAEFDAILELFEKEAAALAGLQHPYIVGVHQFFRDNGTAYMAMDFVDGQTLLDVIETDPDRLDAEAVKKLLIDVLQAVGYIHERDILHRDISPDNILIDGDNLPVLIDFGAARQDATRVSRALSKVLTVKDGYSPQEFYEAGSDQLYSSDLYALAATFYHLLSRTPPPPSHTRLSAAARDLPDPLVPLEKVPGFDPHFVAAINRCLSIFPKDRLVSAAAWRDVVDLERRQQRQLEEAERDQELEARIARLVAEFKQDFAKRQKAAATAPKADVKPGPTARVAKPDPASTAQSEMSERARALSSPDCLPPEDRTDMDDTADEAPRPAPARPEPVRPTASATPGGTRPQRLTAQDHEEAKARLADTPRPRPRARADQPLTVAPRPQAAPNPEPEANP